jgi:hypothetical protein
MDLSGIMKKYADQIGGQFTQYDQSQSIIIIPVSGGRFQTVLGTIKKNELYNRELLTLNSKVCAPTNSICKLKLWPHSIICRRAPSKKCCRK